MIRQKEESVMLKTDYLKSSGQRKKKDKNNLKKKQRETKEIIECYHYAHYETLKKRKERIKGLI